MSELDARLAAGKDTVFVVNFWATWCAPCVAELPNFDLLQKQKFTKPVKVLLMSVDAKSKLTKEVIPFVINKNIASEVLLLNETDQQVYIEQIDKNWSGSIPATLFVWKGKRQFFEKEFTEDELIRVVKEFN
ncbi:TlpA disulfide reductase family protein [Pedobacter sp. MW01-1-1]|uniref:TlpA disulfide reductase family protein n=1 Tax=Pedobacter sp. MW01-1-1 TaxID=3383027 RepID=UPI003FEF06EF